MLVYVLSISLYGVPNHPNKKSLPIAGTSVYSNNSELLHSHTAQTETTLNNGSQVAPPTVKNTTGGKVTLLKTTQHVLLHAFHQYLFYATSLLLRLVQTDIIFPFHYFW